MKTLRLCVLAREMILFTFTWNEEIKTLRSLREKESSCKAAKTQRKMSKVYNLTSAEVGQGDFSPSGLALHERFFHDMKKGPARVCRTLVFLSGSDQAR